MTGKMQALGFNGTWDLVPLLPRQKDAGCHWVFVGPNGEVDHLKVRLIAKGYT